jgi:hypothetical protein
MATSETTMSAARFRNPEKPAMDASGVASAGSSDSPAGDTPTPLEPAGSAVRLTSRFRLTGLKAPSYAYLLDPPDSAAAIYPI